MVRHDNMHRYEWPLGKVVRVFPDPLGVIRTAEVEEGGRSSIRSVTFLVPLELDCYDNEEGTYSKLRQQATATKQPAARQTSLHSTKN